MNIRNRRTTIKQDPEILRGDNKFIKKETFFIFTVKNKYNKSVHDIIFINLFTYIY